MGRAGVEDLAAVVAEISLLAGSPALVRASQKVWVRYGSAQKEVRETRRDPSVVGKFPKALTEAADAREEFLKLARKELGVDP